MKRKYLASFLVLSFLFIISISSINSDLTIKQDKLLAHKSPNEDVYRDANGQFKSIIYTGAVNVPYSQGYIPFKEYVNISEEISKDEKSNRLKIQTIDGEICYLQLDYNLKTKIKDKDGKDIKKASKEEFKITKNSNSYYFYSNISEDVDSMRYIIDCPKSEFKDDSLILLDNIKIDFKQAKTEQNIKTIYNSTTNRLEFSAHDSKLPVDLKYVDPNITYNFNSTYENITMFAYGCTPTSTNYIFDSTSGPLQSCSVALTDLSKNSALDSSDDSRIGIGTSGKSGFFQVITKAPTLVSDDIKLINYTLEGSENVAGNNWNSAWLWNGSKWISCARNVTESTDQVINCNSTSGIYLNSSGYINFLWANQYTGTDFGTLYIDYVSLTLQYDDLIINSPTSNQNILNNLSTMLNTSQSGYNDTIWYTWNNGISNNTLCNTSNECAGTITFPRQGYYNLTVYGNKSNGSVTSKNVSNLFVGNYTLQLNGDFNSTTGSWSNLNKVSDNDFSTSGQAGSGTAGYYTNYSNNSLIGKLINSFLWEVRDDYLPATQYNLTLPGSCINSYNSSFQVLSIISGPAVYTNWSCYNYASGGFAQLRYGSGGGYDHLVFEEQLHMYYYDNNSALSLTNTLSNYYNSSSPNITFNYNISDDNDWIKNVSIIIDGTTNKTNSSVPITANANNSLNFVVTNIPDGLHSYYINACDSDNSCSNSTNQTFRVDSTPPVITWLFPTDDGSIFDGYTNQFNLSVLDSGIGLSSCWWSNNSGIVNRTITCGNNITDIEAVDGAYNISFWANDTLNNINSSVRKFQINSLDPIITLNYPTDNYWWSNGTSRIFNFSVIDTHPIFQCQLWGNWSGSWALNQTNSSTVSNSGTNYNFNAINLPDGYYKWNVWCNETNGRSSWYGLNRTINIDSTYPKITIFSPTNSTYTTNLIDLNFTINDTNRDTCWYSINNTNNITLTSCVNITFTANQGSSNITLYANDSANNLNFTNLTFFVDSITPVLVLNTSFSNGSYLNYNTSIIINITATDTNINSCWYNDNSGTNVTFSCGNNLSLNLPEGLHTIRVYVNDTLNNQNNSQISFTPDVTYPKLYNLSVSQVATTQTFNFSLNITDINYYTSFYTVYNSSGDIDYSISENTTLICTSGLNCQRSDTPSNYGTYTLKVYSRDMAGNENSTNISFTTSQPIITSGGGGGSITRSVVAIIQPDNVTQYGDLQRAIFYVSFLSICKNETKCNLDEDQENSLIINLSGMDVETNTLDLEAFLKNYNNNQLESLELDQGYVNKFNLFTGVLQISQIKPRLNPSQIDSFAIIFFSEEFLVQVESSKKIIDYSIDDNINFRIENVSNNKFNIILKVQNKDFSFKAFTTRASFTDIDGNIVYQSINFRVINLTNGITIISLFVTLGLGIAMFIFRKDLKKWSNNLFPI